MRDNGKTKIAAASEREQKIWDLRVKGWSQQAIAGELGIDQTTVCKALQRTGKKHHEQFMNDVNAYKETQTAELEALAEDLLVQYRRSQQKKISIKESGKVDKKTKQFKEGSITTIDKTDQYGDVKLLEAYINLKEQIAKIWGFTGIAMKKEGTKTGEDMTMEEKCNMFLSLPMDERLKILATMLNPKSSSDNTEKQNTE